MNRVMVLGFLTFLSAASAFSQIRLEFTSQGEGSADARRTIAWAKGCEARIEDVGNTAMYMLLRDCGKTMLGISREEKAAISMPPMLSSPAADVNTAALFMQGNPQISVEKLDEKPGPVILGRPTMHYRFRAIHLPDPRVQEPVKLVVEEEFWTDATLNVPVLEGLFGKAPIGDSHASERTAFAVMKGFPLKHRTVVTVEHPGSRQAQPAFLQEVVLVSTEPFDDNLLQIPKGYQVVDGDGGTHQ